MPFMLNSTLPPENHDLPRAFTTRAQLAERQSLRRRLLWGLIISIAALLLFVLLGPDAESVRERFEYYGVKGELKIMPVISIDDGQDKIHQLPKTLMTPPPPSQIEMEPENLSETATEFVPKTTTDPIDETINDQPKPDPDAEIATSDLVELNLPQQSNPDWFIIKSPKPEYPFGAPEEERRIPIIFVKVAFFVGPDGTVTDAMIQGSNGGAAYADEVIKNILNWELGWRVPPGAGRWYYTTIHFKSPYFTGTTE